jgi:hypothetical protein
MPTTTRPTRLRPGLYGLLGHTVEKNDGGAFDAWCPVGFWVVVDTATDEPWMTVYETLRDAVDDINDEVGGA